MAEQTRKPKLATRLPRPPRLSDLELEQLDTEASAWQAAVSSGTASLERLTEQELRIRLR